LAFFAERQPLRLRRCRRRFQLFCLPIISPPLPTPIFLSLIAFDTDAADIADYAHFHYFHFFAVIYAISPMPLAAFDAARCFQPSCRAMMPPLQAFIAAAAFAHRPPFDAADVFRLFRRLFLPACCQSGCRLASVC
jgi:hypothetical protein